MLKASSNWPAWVLSFGGFSLWAASAHAQPAPDVAPEPGAAETQAAEVPAAGKKPAKKAAAKAQDDYSDRLTRILNRPGGLTADQVADRAVATSTTVQLREADVTVADAEVDKLTAGVVPRLDLTARYTRLSPVTPVSLGPGSGSFVVTNEGPGPLPPGAQLIGVPASAFSFPQILNQYLLQASLTVPISDYLFSTVNAYTAVKRNRRAADLNVKAAKLAQAAEAKAAYYEWVRAELQVVTAQQSVEQSEESARIAQTSFNAGRASKADVMGAESLAANAQLLHERARSQARIAEERLRVLMHDATQKDYAIGEDVLSEQSVPERTQLPTLYTEARRKRLEMQAFEASVEAIESRRGVIKAQALPKLEAFGNVYYARPNQRFIPQQDEWRASWDVGVQLKWSPNDLGSNISEARKIQAEVDRVRAQRAQFVDALKQEVLQAYTSAREAEIAVVAAKRSLEAAEEAYRVQRLLYENGRATTVELLDAETRLLRARLDMINVRINLRIAMIALEHALGRDVQGG